VGWMAGWVYLASYLISIAAVALALQVTLPQIDPRFEILDDPNQNAVLLGCVLITFTTLINAAGVRLLARINNLGVFAELIGAVLLILLLAGHAQRGPGIVFQTQGRAAGQPWGYLGPFLAAAIMASYVMYGFDTAGSLAEETTAPERKVPWAILQALATAAFLGALVLLFGLMAADDLRDPRLGEETGGLPLLVTTTLGPVLGRVFLADVIFAITVCTLAVHTGTVRLLFAMARDNNLPFSRSLARVSSTSHTPIVPAVAAGVLAILLLVGNVHFPHLMDAVCSVAIVWANLAYLLVTVPLLIQRLRGWPAKEGLPQKGVFRLGRWGLPINLLAVGSGVVIILNIGWPREEIYGSAWYERFAAPLFTGILVLMGGVYYGMVQRHKTGVLEEHRASHDRFLANS